MKRHLLIAMMAPSVSACIKSPTLDERLADKTGSERELYLDFIQRANCPIPGRHGGAYFGHELCMRAICDAIHEIKQQEEELATR